MKRTWTLENSDGSLTGTTRDESEAESLRRQGFIVTEVVPASDLAAANDLVQRLAQRHFESRVAAIGLAFRDGSYATEAATDEMKEIGFRKVAGKWEWVK